MRGHSRALAPDTPADVLRRRPDIAAAEQRLHATTARIGMASAELFPRLTLSGLLGMQSFDADTLGHSDIRTFGHSGSGKRLAALGIDWSFLDVGRIRARIAAADADARGALAGGWPERTPDRVPVAGRWAADCGLRTADCPQFQGNRKSPHLRASADSAIYEQDAAARRHEIMVANRLMMNSKSKSPLPPFFKGGEIKSSDFCTSRFAQDQDKAQDKAQAKAKAKAKAKAQTHTQTHGASGFAPFEKGGYGGFALALRNNCRDSNTNADSLRRDPPAERVFKVSRL